MVQRKARCKGEVLLNGPKKHESSLTVSSDIKAQMWERKADFSTVDTILLFFLLGSHRSGTLVYNLSAKYRFVSISLKFEYVYKFHTWKSNLRCKVKSILARRSFCNKRGTLFKTWDKCSMLIKMLKPTSLEDDLQLYDNTTLALNHFCIPLWVCPLIFCRNERSKQSVKIHERKDKRMAW